MFKRISSYLKFRFKSVPGLSSGRLIGLCSDKVMCVLVFSTLSDAMPHFTKTKITPTAGDSMSSWTVLEDRHVGILPVAGLFQKSAFPSI